MRLKPDRGDKISCDGTQVIELRNSKGASQESQGVTAAFSAANAANDELQPTSAALRAPPRRSALPQLQTVIDSQRSQWNYAPVGDGDNSNKCIFTACENIFPGPEIKEHDSNRRK